MLKCIIIDDEKRDRLNLELLLKTYCTNIEIVDTAWDRDSIARVLKENQVDLVFMDIHLGRITIFEIIEELDLDQMDFKIVFVTASEKHAIKGYQYSAIDYILKPIHSQRLIEVVEKAKELKKQQFKKENVVEEFNQLYRTIGEGHKISISDGKEIHVLKIDDILYCEGERNYTKIVLNKDRTIIISKNLKYFENSLQTYNFLRIHKSYLVNLAHIDALSKDQGISATMTNGAQIPVSKSSKEILFSKMNII